MPEGIALNRQFYVRVVSFFYPHHQENGKRKEREKENIFLYVFLNVGKKKKKRGRKRKQIFSLLWFSKRMEREITVFYFIPLKMTSSVNQQTSRK